MKLKVSKILYLKDGFAPVWKFSKDPNDTIVAAGYGDGKLMVYDYGSGKTLIIISAILIILLCLLIFYLGKWVEEISSHIFAVNDIDWSSHYNYLASASDDTLAMIHDLNIQSESVTDEHEGFQDIYQKELDKNINLDKSLVRIFKGHTHHVTSIKFDQGTSIVLTGSIDKTYQNLQLIILNNLILLNSVI